MHQLTDFGIVVQTENRRDLALESSLNDCTGICRRSDTHHWERRRICIGFASRSCRPCHRWTRTCPSASCPCRPWPSHELLLCFGEALEPPQTIRFLSWAFSLLGCRSSGVLLVAFSLRRCGHLVLAFNHQTKINLGLAHVLLFTLSHDATIDETEKGLI